MQNIEENNIYVCKILTEKYVSDPKNQRQVKNEYSIHSSLKHENIVGFIEFFHRRGDLNIVLSFCENGSLRQYVKRSRNNLSINDYEHFVVQILNGVCYMHDQNIIHRDLKCSNLLLDSKMSVKICDFGLAIHANEARLESNRICGTLNYMAPEILERKLYSFGSDIWAIGVITYNLLFGKLPFAELDAKHIEKRIKGIDYK